MKEVVRKEALTNLDQLIVFLRTWPNVNIEVLKALSDKGIENVALYKNLDIISITVLTYSLYKLIPSINSQEIITNLIIELEKARNALAKRDLPKYNLPMKKAFTLVQSVHGEVREHLQDVLAAARIKKGTALLEHGLSIGQAAGLMGLSNWDLQEYAAKTTALGIHVTIPVEKRLKNAFKLFNL
ncbi:hypothetical protein HYV86_07110 [Candidatus Woesearchaeota archaeon]|nr:hypothetical protein [Candidatus Woesearchaeota archaeon]